MNRLKYINSVCGIYRSILYSVSIRVVVVQEAEVFKVPTLDG